MASANDANLSVADYVAKLHRMGEDELGAHLGEMLQHPGESLPRLSVFVPEVGLMLTRIMFLRDYDAVTDMAEALSAPLAALGILGGGRLPAEAAGDADALAELQYQLGRLVALLVVAKRFLLLDSLERLRQEFLDGGVAQSVMEMLQAGPRSQRSIGTALRSKLGSHVQVRPQELREVLKRLIREELVGQAGGTGKTQNLELTDLGQQLLQDEPPWVADVEEAYRSYRHLQATSAPTATQRSLVKLFLRLDREAGRELPLPTTSPSPRAFPFVDASRVPDEEGRGLPRIIP